MESIMEIRERERERDRQTDRQTDREMESIIEIGDGRERAQNQMGKVDARWREGEKHKTGK